MKNSSWTRALSPRSWALAALATAALAGAAHGQATFYANNFDANNGGWSETGFGDWEWGTLGTFSNANCSTTAFEPHGQPQPSGVGVGMWGTVLDACHNNNGGDATLTQTFNFTGWTGMSLKYHEYVAAGGNTFDMCRIFVNGTQIYLSDGNSGPLASGQQAAWEEMTFALPASTDNNATVTIEYRFTTTTGTNRAGWYIDNVRLEGTPPATPGVNTLITSFTDSGDPNCAGSAANVTYTVGYNNFGTDPATNTLIAVPLPSGATYVSGDAGVTYNMGLNQVERAPGSVANLAAGSFSFVLNLSDTPGDYTLTATISQTEVDTDTANNSANQTTTVITGSGPSNDTCASPTALSGLGTLFTGTITNQCAGDDSAPGGCSGEPSTYGGVWFSLTPVNFGILTCVDSGAQDVVWAIFDNCANASLECKTADSTNFGLNGGTTYYILVGAQNPGTANRAADLNLNISFSETPLNDVCSNATNLATVGSFPSSPITITDTNTAATDDVDNTCNTGSSSWGGLWYKYTNTTGIPGALRLSETGNQDVVIAWAKNASCDPALFDVCNSTDAGPHYIALDLNESVLILVSAQTTSTSRVDNFNLGIEWITGAPVNDTCDNAVNLATAGLPGSTVNLTIDNRAAQNDIDIGTCNTGSSSWGGVWFTYTPTVGGLFTFTETGAQDVAWAYAINSSCTPSTYTICTGTDTAQSVSLNANDNILITVAASSGASTTRDNSLQVSFGYVVAPANDDCTSATSVGTLASPFAFTVNNTSANNDLDTTCSSGTSSWGGVWYSFHADSNGALVLEETSARDVVWAVMTDCGGGGIACSTNDSQQFPVVAGTDYLIQLSSLSSTTTRGELTGTISFAAVPANDTCATATSLGSLSSAVRIVQSNAAASDDIDAGTCNTGSSSWGGVWYTFTAPSAGTLYFSENSAQDVVWAVFATCASGTSTLCDATDGDRTFVMSNGQSVQLLVSALATGTSRVAALDAVFGFYPTGGVPANDDCTGAINVGSLPFISVVNAPSAASDATPTCSTNGAILSGVWYSYTTGADGGQLLIEETSGNDVLIASYTGACGSLTQAGCTTSESFAFTLQANTTYKFLVGRQPATAATAPYAVRFTSFTPGTGGCCNGNTCTVTTGSACTGTFLGVDAPCAGAFHAASNNLPMQIPDNSSNSSTLDLTDAGTVGTIEVTVDVSHTWYSDLVLQLSNGSTTINLTDYDAASLGNDAVGIYTFKDSAAQTFQSAALANTVIPSGSYKPDQALSAFNGAPIAGTWTLIGADDAAAISGIVNAWSLFVAPSGGANNCPAGPTPCQVADFDNNNAVSVNDLFVFLDAWFAQNGMSGMGLSADVDGNNAVSVNDLFVFLDLWFTYNGQSC